MDEQLELFGPVQQEILFTCKNCNAIGEREKFKSKNFCKVCSRVKDDYRRFIGRKYVFKYYLQHPCIDCGEKDPFVLQLDHVTGDKHKDVSKMVSGRTTVKTLEKEIKKCVVRCANCHSKKTARDQKWYKEFYDHDAKSVKKELEQELVQQYSESSTEAINEDQRQPADLNQQEGLFQERAEVSFS
jgi:hypothetical protein